MSHITIGVCERGETPLSQTPKQEVKPNVDTSVETKNKIKEKNGT